jgi:GT2 family glycosyltransferase|nr:glycosyltransferase family 2 protein [uncultured Flavobacterium sp.]
MVDISIIIVNYKSWSELNNCLQSIITIDSDRFALETIVVDNQSNDGKINEFKQLFPTISFIENSGNNGFANGCNLGASTAKGKYLFFLNPDTVINEDAVFKLWKTSCENTDYGIVSCLQTNETNGKYTEIRFFPTLFTLFGLTRVFFRIINYFNLRKKFNFHKEIVFPDWVTGAVIFISREWFASVNGWSEKYWLYFEDVDICKKIQEKNGKICLIRTANIFHKHGGATRININTKALTKTEVLISKHVYFSEHKFGIIKHLIQSLLLTSLLFEKFILAILGLIFFFIPKLKVNIFIFINLIKYYKNAISKKTWTSPRSVKYLQK